MGNPKQKWTSEEEEALRAGVAKHGAGKWKNIQKDPEFNHLLFARSNIDLKDKWRNLSVANGQGARDKSKIPKAKVSVAESPALPPLVPKISTSVAPMPPNASNDVLALEAPRPFHEGNNTAKYNAVICEAISSLNQANGSECSAIAAFIEQKQEVPPNFKRLLSSKLRRLVQQNKLEKVQNSYRLKRETPHSKRMSMAPIEPLPKQMQTGHSPQPRGDHFEETIENAAISAALRVAEAENISFVAAEATKEAERVSRMAEHQNLLIAFCLECLEQSSHGDVLIRQ